MLSIYIKSNKYASRGKERFGGLMSWPHQLLLGGKWQQKPLAAHMVGLNWLALQ